MLNEETYVRQRVRVKPHPREEAEDAPALASDDEEVGYQEYQSRRQSLSADNLQPYDIFTKVMLLGDSGVGKTCLLMRFRDGLFLSGNFISTVGVDFRVRGIASAFWGKVGCAAWAVMSGRFGGERGRFGKVCRDTFY